MSLTATLDRPLLSSPRHRSCRAFLRSVSSISARPVSLPYGGMTISSLSPGLAISRVASSLRQRLAPEALVPDRDQLGGLADGVGQAGQDGELAARERAGG